MATDQDLIEVELSKIVLQQKNESQYIFLREQGGSRTFPIVIGDHEAFEIRRKLRAEQPGRPLTHDLIGRILIALEARLDRVIVNALREHTFFASLVLVADAGERVIDCRPSDAIALAVQVRCPLFVDRSVLDQVAPDANPPA